MGRGWVENSRLVSPYCPGYMGPRSRQVLRSIPWVQVRYEIVEEHYDRVRIRVEYVVPSGSEGYHNYPMLRSNREQSFFAFAWAPSRSGLAVNVDVCCEYRDRWEMESMIRILEGDFDISVLNVYHPQEGFSRGRVGNVTNQYSTKVEEYERTDTATLDCLYPKEVRDRTVEADDSTKKLTIIRSPVCQFHTTRLSSCSPQSVLVDQSSAS